MKNQWQLLLIAIIGLPHFFFGNSLTGGMPDETSTGHLFSLHSLTVYNPSTKGFASFKGEPVAGWRFGDASWTPPVGLCPTSPTFNLNTLLNADAIPGGSWTINGSPAINFAPDVLGEGTHIVTYTVGPASETHNIIIDPLPNPAWEPPSILCVNTLPFPLSSMLFPDSEPDGDWLIDGEAASEFNPGLLGEGEYVVSYTVGPPPCVNSLTQLVTIGPLPQAGWTPPDSLCTDYAAIDLFDLLDPGSSDEGIWRINNMPISNIFDPAVYGEGAFTITYDVGFFPCNDTETHDIIVSGQTSAEWMAADTLCQGSGTIPLDSFLGPNATPGGYWTVNGVLDSILLLNSLDTGTYLLTYRVGPLGCNAERTDSVYVALAPDASFELPVDTICRDELLTVTLADTVPDGALISWDLDGGTADPFPPLDTFTVSWPSAGSFDLQLSVTLGNCTTLQTSTVEVLPLPDVPEPLCGPSTTSSVTVSWDTLSQLTTYAVEIPGIDTLTLDTTWLEISGLDPEQNIELIIRSISAQNCFSEVTDTLTCTAAPCPDVSITITSVDTLCLDGQNAPVDLDVAVSTSEGMGYWQGPGITDTLAGTFDPLTAGPGLHLVFYHHFIDNCSWSDSLFISAFPVPEATFIAPDSVCTDQPLELTYTGSSSGTAFYDWNLDDGALISGTGPGPLLVSWAVPGTRTISLQVTENSCLSESYEQTVVVSPPPPMPEVNCWASPEAVVFFWEESPGINYELDVLNGPLGNLTSGTTYLVDGLTEGTSVTVAVTALGMGGCPDSTALANCISQPCPDIDITFPGFTLFCLPYPGDSLQLSAFISGGLGNGISSWQGPGITDPLAGWFNPHLAGNGTHTLTYTYREGLCEYTATLDLTVGTTPDPSFTVTEELCVSETATVLFTGNAGAGAVFDWNFDGANIISGAGAGPYLLQWDTPGMKNISLTVTDEGCASSPFTAVAQVDPLLETPLIECSATYSTLTFSWAPVAGSEEYLVDVLSGPDGQFIQTTAYQLTGLTPGEEYTIRLTIISDNACPNVITTFSCMTQPCPEIELSIDFPPLYCLDDTPEPVTLPYTLIGDSPDGFLFWSGPGIIDGINGVWLPAPGMVGQEIPIVLTYTEDVCVYSDTMIIEVLETPVAEFSATGTICVTDATLVIYTGLAPAGADFDWDFDGATVLSGSGPGPYELQWDTPGTYDISLAVTDVGCTSETFTSQVIVEPTLAEPVVNCTASYSTLVFSWDEVPGAAGYEVDITPGLNGEWVSATSYQLSGLTPGEDYSILLTVLSSNACPDLPTEISCSTLPCPDIDITIDPVPTICLTGNNEPINLHYTATGDTTGGTFTWSGPGIFNDDGGWLPAPQMAGQNIPVTVTYVEDVCQVSETLLIEVRETPTSTFTLGSPLCITDSVLITYSGNAPDDAIFNWDFDGGNAQPGSGPGPQWVQWMAAGTKYISLSVESDGCFSDTTTEELILETSFLLPTIDCQTTLTSLAFQWNEYPTAEEYIINILDGPANGEFLDEITYYYENLDPGQEITMELTIVSGNSCPSVTVVQTCSTLPCPDVTFEFEELPPVCPREPAEVIQIGYEVFGGNNGGSLLWSGPGIVDPEDGWWLVSPEMAGQTIPLVVTYTEEVCVTSDTFYIEVQEPPVVDFSATSPICLTDSALVTVDNVLPPGAVFYWDFGGGQATPGAGQGPHFIQWPEPGEYPVRLSVAIDGCPSDTVTQTVRVDTLLVAPLINCQANESSLTFVWEEVPGAGSYEVEVLSGLEGVLINNTSYQINGILPGQDESIELSVFSSGSCPPVTTQQSCTMPACPVIELTIDPVPLICLTSEADTVQLTYTITGEPTEGTFHWSAPGIINPDSGQWIITSDLDNQNVPVILTYSEGICTYSDTLIVPVQVEPTASFTANPVICLSDTLLVTYSGNAGADDQFSWDFDSASAIPGTGIGPHLLNWDVTGTQTISLTVTSGECSSEPFVQSVTVDPPLPVPIVSCTSDYNSIVYSWEEVPGADGYEIEPANGQSGVLTGDNQYEINGLEPGQEMTLSVIALSANTCPDAVTELTCATTSCPEISLLLSGDTEVCTGDSASLVLNFTGNFPGPYSVSLQIGTDLYELTDLNDGAVFRFLPAGHTVVSVIEGHPAGAPECSLDLPADWQVQVVVPTSSGNPLPAPALCQGVDTLIGLQDLLTGETAGGQWEETSILPSTGNAFDASAGTFRTAGQPAGTYRFRYALLTPSPCGNDSTTVAVEILPIPVADAGLDQTLTCRTPVVTLGSSLTSTGPSIVYQWTALNDSPIDDPNAPITDASRSDLYILRVLDAQNGCADSSQVRVFSDINYPLPITQIEPVSCFGEADGRILVDTVLDGQPPYRYRLNEGAPQDSPVFENLPAGDYLLEVIDAEGCTGAEEIFLPEPPELSVILRSNFGDIAPLINWGDLLELRAEVNRPVDTIFWSPDSLNFIGSPFVKAFSPRTTATYQVSVKDSNGCPATDSLRVIVDLTPRIYVPNVFSPNDDGLNDRFTVFTGPEVEMVEELAIFTRWGEQVFAKTEFPPNDENLGWDGKNRGRLMNVSVFAYRVTVRLVNGQTHSFKGDVLLLAY